ncbi:hypothetical protein K435DRAFT_618337, partial [Dendrothele bispora CBS 962.96]
VEVRHATDDSHTGEWIKGLIKPWIEKIGFERFCATCSDSTGNTLLARQLLAKDFPTVLPIADICHHLDNTNKDIVKIKYFDEVVKIIRGTIKSFSVSHAGKSALKKARQQLRVGAGLEAIGNTRFVTVILSAISIQRNLEAIKRALASSERFDFEYSKYFQVVQKSYGRNFEAKLEQLIAVGLPIAKALTCLESNDANPADVFIFWHAVIFHIEKTITDEENDYPPEVQEEILTILNFRHSQLFCPGGRLYNAVYLATAYLNPGYLMSDLFIDNDIDPSHPTSLTTINNLQK